MSISSSKRRRIKNLAFDLLYLTDIQRMYYDVRHHIEYLIGLAEEGKGSNSVHDTLLSILKEMPNYDD